MKPFDFAWRKIYWKIRDLAFKLMPGDPLGLTTHEIAAKYQVNVKTVTRAIRQLKAEGVVITKRKHGTFVHPLRMRLSKDGKIILHVARGYEYRTDYPILSPLCERLESIAAEKNCRIMTISPHRIIDVLDLLKEGQVFGAIVNTMNGMQSARTAIERLRSFGVKICALEDALPGVDSVIYDNIDIGRQIGEMLINRLGNERLLMLRMDFFSNGSFEREEGFRKAVHAHKVDLNVVWLNLIAPWSRNPRLVEDHIRHGIRFDCAYLPAPGIHQLIRNICKSLKTPVPFMAAFGTREELDDGGIAGAYLDIDKYVGDAVNLLFDQSRDPLRPPVVIKHKALTYIPV